MIREILHLLAANEFMIKDNDIQFAKGALELPSSFKEIKEKRKRKKLMGNGRR
jgi:hypothetical protein